MELLRTRSPAALVPLTVKVTAAPTPGDPRLMLGAIVACLLAELPV
jgi:hypothetical protein